MSQFTPTSKRIRAVVYWLLMPLLYIKPIRRPVNWLINLTYRLPKIKE